VSAATTTITIDDITLAKALEDLKTSKPKIRGIVIKDREEPKITQENGSKRAGDELEQKSSKKQKIDDGTDDAELKQLVNIILKEDIAIDAIPLAVKTPTVDWMIYKEGKKRPEKGYEGVLWGDLKVMFDPHVEDEVWKLQQSYKVVKWTLFN
nr:hypothetical protein [Tanacetum cinerariifolium]